ncbi:unnamed protein product [Rhizopus stolonifer]
MMPTSEENMRNYIEFITGESRQIEGQSFDMLDDLFDSMKDSRKSDVKDWKYIIEKAEKLGLPSEVIDNVQKHMIKKMENRADE